MHTYHVEFSEYEYHTVQTAVCTLGDLSARLVADRARFAGPAEDLHAEACRAIARVMRSVLSRGHVRIVHESEAAE